MQTQTSCVFVNTELWTGCFRLGCRDRREGEEEEENVLGQREGERTEDKKERMSYSEDTENVKGGSYWEKRKVFTDLEQLGKIFKIPWGWFLQVLPQSNRWFLWDYCTKNYKTTKPQIKISKSKVMCQVFSTSNQCNTNQNKQRKEQTNKSTSIALAQAQGQTHNGITNNPPKRGQNR